MDPSYQMTTLQAGGSGGMVWEMLPRVHWVPWYLWIQLWTAQLTSTTLTIACTRPWLWCSLQVMVTFSRTMHLATMLDQSQIGLRNISRSLVCFHGHLCPRTSILLSICDSFKDRFNAWKRHHLIWPSLEWPLCKHAPTFLSNGISILLSPC